MPSQAALELLINMRGDAEKGLGSLGGTLKSLGGVALGVAAGGIAAIGATLISSIGDARESAKVFAQTEAVIKSTGDASGRSAQQVADYASSLSAAAGKSLFGDEQILESSNMLLTFTNIKGAALDAATAVSVDMAQAFGGAPKDAAIQLGKALNDPIKGITALTRVGVTFDEQQKAQIKAMQDAGDTAGAQAIILKELNKEFGGSAAAAAKADGGVAQFWDSIGEAKEKLGGIFLPLLTKAFGFLNEHVMPIINDVVASIGNFTAAIQRGAGMFTILKTIFPPDIALNIVTGIHRVQRAFEAVKTIVLDVIGAFQTGGLGAAIGALFNDLAPLAVKLGQTLLGWGKALIDWILPMIPPMLAALGGFVAAAFAWIVAQAPGWIAQLWAWAHALVDWIAPYIPVVLQALSAFISAAWAWVKEQAPLWLAQLQAWGAQLIAWIGPMIPPLIAKLGELLAAAFQWVKDRVPEWLAQLASWGQALVDWVTPVTAPLIGRLGTLASDLWAWIGAQASVLLARFSTWATAFGAWVPGAATDFLARWPKILNDWLTWIGDQAGPLLAKLGDWGLQFVAWIAPKIPGILLALAGVAAAILVFIGETTLVLSAKLLEWAWALVKWIATDAVPKLAAAWEDFKTALGNLIVQGATWLATEAGKLGASLIDGMIKGITDGVGRLGTALNDAANGALNSITGGGGVPAIPAAPGVPGAGSSSGGGFIPSGASGGGTANLTVGSIVVQGASDPDKTAEAVRQKLLELGRRNLNIFGGLA